MSTQQDKYIKKNRTSAHKQLVSRIQQELPFYAETIPEEIEKILQQFLNPLPYIDEEQLNCKEKIKNRLRSIGEEIAQQLYEQVEVKIAPFVKKNIEEMVAIFSKKQSEVTNNTNNFELLLAKIHSNRYGKSKTLWRGADVIITPSVISQENLIWSHSDDNQVITGSIELARVLSWLFNQIKVNMSPLIDFQNKGFIYGTLADTAKHAINFKGECEYNDEQIRNILLAVYEKAIELRTEWLSGFNEDISNKHQAIEVCKSWLEAKLQQ